MSYEGEGGDKVALIFSPGQKERGERTGTRNAAAQSFEGMGSKKAKGGSLSSLQSRGGERNQLMVR